MLKSMTAYGRATIAAPLGHFTAEIQSVNRKHLEIHTYLPKELTRFDSDVRKWISEAVNRGQINVKINACFELESPVVVKPNLSLARQIKGAWDAIANDLGLDPAKSFNLSLLKNETGILLYEEDLKNEDEVRSVLKKAIEEALNPFLEMKQVEGHALYLDIAKRLKRLEEAIQKINSKASGATDKFRQKLIDRIEEVLPGKVENEERILREIALYAEKIDIEEEITRFNSHLKQVDSLIQSKSGSIGKSFEFLLQELNREANTIGSKTSDVEVSHLVVSMKSELERIREQIQNIE